MDDPEAITDADDEGDDTPPEETDDDGDDDGDGTISTVTDDENNPHPHESDLSEEELRSSNLRAPNNVKEEAIVKCTTTAGPITMKMHRDWSPRGYDRATTLFERGYYDASHFFRVVPKFLVQFGISYTTDVNLKQLADSTFQDDPKREDLMPFREGYVSFAGSGPNSRTSQLFISYGNGGLGNSLWETPIGEVIDGMDNVRKLYSGYGDMPPWGKGPQQGPIRNLGASYIENDFPLLDSFLSCTVQRIDDFSAFSARVDKGILTGRREMKVNAVEEGKQPLSLLGKISIVALVLGVTFQVVVKRKKSKRAGKTV